jgi:hypothetical protein
MKSGLPQEFSNGRKLGPQDHPTQQEGGASFESGRYSMAFA